MAPKPAATTPAPASSQDLPIHTFPTAQEFETFITANHTKIPGIYIKHSKKASGIPSITYDEALEIALCHGWIDGMRKRFDDEYFIQRWTPRRAKSIWSQRNVATVGRLIEEGRMRPAGMAAVEAAKSDGRWERAYAGGASMTVPGDLREELDKVPDAAAAFEGLSKAERYSVLFRLQQGAEKSRVKRIGAVVQKLADKDLETNANQRATVKANVRKDVTADVKSRSSRKRIGPSSPDTPPESKQPRRRGLRSQSGL